MLKSPTRIRTTAIYGGRSNLLDAERREIKFSADTKLLKILTTAVKTWLSSGSNTATAFSTFTASLTTPFILCVNKITQCAPMLCRLTLNLHRVPTSLIRTVTCRQSKTSCVSGEALLTSFYNIQISKMALETKCSGHQRSTTLREN